MQNNAYLDVCVTRCLQEARLCEVLAVWYSVKQSIKDTMSRLFAYFIKTFKNFYVFLLSPVKTLVLYIQLFGTAAITAVHLFCKCTHFAVWQRC